MTTRLLAVAFIVLQAFTACATEVKSGIEIPATDDRRDRLDVVLPIAKGKTASLVIWHKEGKCQGQIGPIKIEFLLPPPCDIMTLGATNHGFAPRVRYDEKDVTPKSVRFQIVGALKYYPAYRAECGDQWRNIELTWPGPIIRVGAVNDAMSQPDVLHCPRFYVDLKPSGMP